MTTSHVKLKSIRVWKSHTEMLSLCSCATPEWRVVQNWSFSWRGASTSKNYFNKNRPKSIVYVCSNICMNVNLNDVIKYTYFVRILLFRPGEVLSILIFLPILGWSILMNILKLLCMACPFYCRLWWRWSILFFKSPVWVQNFLQKCF